MKCNILLDIESKKDATTSASTDPKFEGEESDNMISKDDVSLQGKFRDQIPILLISACSF